MSDLEAELRAAVRAVRAASRLCRGVQRRLVTAETLEKKDKSPVTVADLASQALVCRELAAAFPGDPVVGEEDAKALRQPAQAALLAAVVRELSEELGEEVAAASALDWIDRGGHGADAERYWTLDPIDGTKGFLRGEQYAVALALIERGEVRLGVLGCPNLPAGGAQAGAIFAARRGEGAWQLPLSGASTAGQRIRVDGVRSAAEARFCESVESGHSNQDESARVAALLGIHAEPYRIDSQCKYAAVARGDASIYLRMPTRADYQEKVWDHAAGAIVVEEAGGRVSDVTGQPLDFRQGRTLARNRGVVATSGAIHAAVIEAVERVRGAAG